MDSDHGWMVTINGIQTLLNIDEQGLDNHTFKESSTHWLDYNIYNNNILNQFVSLNVYQEYCFVSLDTLSIIRYCSI